MNTTTRKFKFKGATIEVLDSTPPREHQKLTHAAIKSLSEIGRTQNTPRFEQKIAITRLRFFAKEYKRTIWVKMGNSSRHRTVDVHNRHTGIQEITTRNGLIRRDLEWIKESWSSLRREVSATRRESQYIPQSDFRFYLASGNMERMTYDAGMFVRSKPGYYLERASRSKWQKLINGGIPAIVGESSTKILDITSLEMLKSDTNRLTAVELEFLSCVSHDRIAYLISEKLPHADKYVRIGSDGSLRPNTEVYPDHTINTEIRLVAPRSEFDRVLSAVCEVLNSPEGNQKRLAVVNKSCGLHVHLDMRQRYRDSMGAIELLTDGSHGIQTYSCNRWSKTAIVPEWVKSVYSNLRVSQNVMLAMQPESRKDNQYCRPSKATNLVSQWSAQRRAGYSGRYRVINALSLEKHRTIEIRCHSGSIDADKISAWVRMLWTIASVSPTNAPKRLISVKSWAKKVGLDQLTTAYIARRLNEHVTDTAPAPIRRMRDELRQAM